MTTNPPSKAESNSDHNSVEIDENNISATNSNANADANVNTSSSPPMSQTLPPSYGDVMEQSVFNLQQKLDVYSQLAVKSDQSQQELASSKGNEDGDNTPTKKKSRAEAEAEAEAERQLAFAAHTLASSHPDPKIRAQWQALVDQSSSAETSPSERKGIVMELIERAKRETKRKTVLGTVLAVPRWVVGTAFYAVGGAAHGVGKVFDGVGGLVKGNGSRRYSQ